MPEAMSWFVWVYVVMFAVIAAVFFLVLRRKSSLDTAVERLSRSGGLAVPAELEDAIRARVLTKLRWRLAGAIIVPAVGLTVVAAFGTFTALSGNLLPLGLFFYGLNIGNAMGTVAGEVRSAAAGPLVERTRTVSLDDYVPRLLQVLVPIALGVALVLAVIAALQLKGTHSSRAFVAEYVASSLTNIYALAALSILGVVAWLVAAARVARRPRAAGSSTELAWSDALRADCLNGLAGTALIGPLYCLVALGLSAGLLSEWISGLGSLLWAVIIAGTALLVVGIVITARSPQRFYLRRLWPDTYAQRKAALFPTPLLPADDVQP